MFVFFVVFLLDVFSSGVWASLADLREPSLTGLVSRLQSTVIASRAPGTTDAHRRAFTRWKNFASFLDEIQVFPARTEHVALYLQHLLDTTHSHSAVDSAIYGTIWRGYLPLLTVLLFMMLVEQLRGLLELV